MLQWTMYICVAILLAVVAYYACVLIVILLALRSIRAQWRAWYAHKVFVMKQRARQRRIQWLARQMMGLKTRTIQYDVKLAVWRLFHRPLSGVKWGVNVYDNMVTVHTHYHENEAPNNGPMRKGYRRAIGEDLGCDDRNDGFHRTMFSKNKNKSSRIRKIKACKMPGFRASIKDLY